MELETSSNSLVFIVFIALYISLPNDSVCSVTDFFNERFVSNSVSLNGIFHFYFIHLFIIIFLQIYHLPWILDPHLNEDQKDIIRKIAAPSIDAPPLVVFGPFGTGKTFTLSQAVRRIAVNRNNRVLICTHSNSAADMHVELLNKYLQEQRGIAACRPLRIYTPIRKLSTVSDKVKQYCLIADKGKPTEVFRLPTRDEVLSHRVVVSTLGMSRALFDMELHRGFFTHILIDEAAQALETETLTPITLAGNNTKVVFTGDHMQVRSLGWKPVWGFGIVVVLK